MELLIVGDNSGDSYRGAIDHATDYTGLLIAITDVYRHSSPVIFAQRTAEALALAELAAMYGLTQDNPLTDSLLTMNSRWWRLPRLFHEAVTWFSERIEKASSVPVVYEFGDQTERRAPIVAAAAQLDTAARLRAKTQQAQQQELPLEQGKAELYALLRDLGCDPKPVASHPIIQEEAQARFSRTRESILSLDFYRAAYPYWRYSSVLDERTTAGCKALNGLTMPSSDPRWVGFVPPRHWRCRAHVVAVVHSDGVGAPKTEPDAEYAGDGSFGTLRDEWEPKPGSYPEDLWEIYAAARGIASPHVEIPGAWWRRSRPSVE